MLRTNQQWMTDLQSHDPIVRDGVTVELQDRLRRTIFSQFIAKGLTAHCVEDVVQEASVRIFQRLDTFRGDSQFTTWAIAFAVRTGLEMLRRGFWAARPASDFLIADNPVNLTEMWEDLGLQPHVKAQQEEVLQLLSVAMNEGLTGRQRCALLGELQGWTIAKIAMEMGTTRGAVYKLTHDARKRLKMILLDSGFDGDTIQELFSS